MGTLNWLDPEQYTSLNQWNRYYFDAKPGYWGGIELETRRVRKERELFDELSACDSRTKAEITLCRCPEILRRHMLPGVDAAPATQTRVCGALAANGWETEKAYEEMAELALAHP